MSAAAANGLPGPLPEGESLLWQGAPEWKSLSLRAFHIRLIAIYFAIILAWVVASGLVNERPPLDIASTVLVAGALAAAALAILAMLGGLSSRTTRYTLTDRRIVMRFGIALPISLNIPLKTVETADFKGYSDGTGDISLALRNEGRTAYLMLWPHARPWRLAKAEPTLRSLPDAARVAALLSRTLAADAGQPASRVVEAPIRNPEAAEAGALRPTFGATASG